MAKRNWIVSVCNTEADGVWITRVKGTKRQVKKYMLKLAAEDEAECEDEYEYGPETVDDVEESNDGKELNAYATYSTYHIDYTACLESSLKPLVL